MIVRIALLNCISILFELTFSEASIPFDDRRDEGTKSFDPYDVATTNNITLSDRSINSVRKLSHPEKVLLAGENTPVWTASYPEYDRGSLIYKKLKKGIVKQAITYWRSDESRQVNRGRRSVDENVPQREEHSELIYEHSLIPHLDERLKREDKNKVFYPSVLAVMEYGKTWPSNKEEVRTLVMEKILYALAFWNNIDLQLREIKELSVRIQLAGIVIAKNRDATNNLYEAYGSRALLHYEGTLFRLVEYWGDRMRRKIDFQPGTYNIVALMTDDSQSPKRSTDGVLPDGLPCDRNNLGATGALIISDDLEFSGLQEAVRLTARMLGHGADNNSPCKYRSDWTKRTWNQCDLDSIRKSLMRNGWCMEKPMEYHDPGKPVYTILPGALISLERQCKAHGWKAGHACKRWTCKALRCQEDYLSMCGRKHAPLDGSECGDGMICSNEKCVSDEILERS